MSVNANFVSVRPGSARAGLLLAVAALLAPSVSAAAIGAAEVVLITGRGTATSPDSGSVRALIKGDAIAAGEIINSLANSYVNLKFSDGSFILLRPNSRFVIESYVDASAAPAPVITPTTARPATPPATVTAPASPVVPRPTPAPVPATPARPLAAAAPQQSSQAFFGLLRGGFRAVSGLIGRADRSEYRVHTPVATIGIRGTDYLVVLCDAACASDPVLRDEAAGGHDLEGGLVANVVEGGIEIRPTCESDTADCRRDALALDAGYTAALTAGGRSFVFDRLPQFLVKQPIPDPQTICQ